MALNTVVCWQFEGGGGGGTSVGRARDSGWGGPGFNPRCGRPLPTGWVGVSILWPAETEVMSPHSVLCVALIIVSLGNRPRYSLVVDEDIKKPNQQTSGNVLRGYAYRFDVKKNSTPEPALKLAVGQSGLQQIPYMPY